MRCPLCDAKVHGRDRFCGECGTQLPPASERGRRRLILPIVGAAVVTAIGCTIFILGAAILAGVFPPLAPQPSPTATLPPTATTVPTPSVGWVSYESAELGLSLSYPQDWLVKEDPLSRAVVFAEREKDLQVDVFPTGTSVVAGRLERTELGAATAREVLESASRDLLHALTALEVGPIQPRVIGEEEGAWMAIGGRVATTSVRGCIAAAVVGDYAYMIVGVAPANEWQGQEPILRAILDSVQFSTPLPEPDLYEPDDTPDQGTSIATDGTEQRHNFHVEGDHDYVFFEAQATQAYIIEALNLAGDVDTIIYLYDEEGNELAYDDDNGAEPLASRLIWVPPENGTYYVMIRDLGEDSAGPRTAYSIRVSAQEATAGADRYEPDDTMAEATPIVADNVPQTHTFHLSTDVDYLSFAAGQGVEYTIATGHLQGGCDTRIFLYDESGAELDFDDDSGEEILAARLVWSAPSSGTYYVMVEEFTGRAGPGVSYDVWLSR
jgi:hypothetical protein